MVAWWLGGLDTFQNLRDAPVAGSDTLIVAAKVFGHATLKKKTPNTRSSQRTRLDGEALAIARLFFQHVVGVPRVVLVHKLLSVFGFR